LNLCSGENKIEGFLSVDAVDTYEPDIILDLGIFPWPIEDETIQEVIFYHGIEHFPRSMHPHIMKELSRVMQTNATLTITYPDSIKCFKNFAENYKGKKDFWEATILGRQLDVWDTHKSLMTETYMWNLLVDAGFVKTEIYPELREPHNTIVRTYRGLRRLTREEGVKQELFGE
jgi:predicted SAM-dependent methyltransferase